MNFRQWRLPAVAVLASALTGCGEFVVSPRYVSQDIANPEIGRQMAIELVVADQWQSGDLLGVTQDTYKQPIRANKPVSEIVRAGFCQALTACDWVVSDKAEFTCRVTLLEAKLVWAAKFNSNHQARIVMNVALFHNGKQLGIRRIREEGWIENRLGDPDELEGGRCFSVVLSRAIDRAVSDKALFTVPSTSAGPAAR